MMTFTGCASKFAPVVSRPDNLIIECETGCKFNVPMNTEIMVARNTNGYDMGKELIKQIPFMGAIALSWKSMNTAENIAETAIESFDKFRQLAGSQGSTTSTITNNTTTTTTGDTITTGDTVSTSTDSSGSGNSSEANVATTTGDTIDSSGSGNSADTTNTSTVDYNNVNNPSTITYPVSP